jgi:hypothetical protein
MIIAVNNKKELVEKFKGVNIEGRINKILQSFQKYPFKEKTKEVWIPEIGKSVEFENLEFGEDEQIKPKNYLDYTFNEINFIEDEFCDSWEHIKAKTVNEMLMGGDLLFLSHFRNTIKGKPQLVHATKQKIILLRRVEKKDKKTDEMKTKYVFIGDLFDKRYDGFEKERLALDFWVYRVIENGKEHYILSEEVLDNKFYVFNGMQIELDDFSEVSKNTKIRSLSSIFLLKDSNPLIKTISKEELLGLTKFLKEEINFGFEEFKNYVFLHPDGKVYDYSEDFNLLRIAQILSGKVDGYPLHIKKVGIAGTGKTYEQESLNYKFDEEQGILEGADSTPKALEPSFKEKPANIGYIAKCHRFAYIDELYKMIENQINKSHNIDASKNHLGSLNFLLELKKRMVGSGNDNSVVVESTAKLSITTNPLSGKRTIYEHIGVIDPSTLSRMIIWVQDNDEVNKIFQRESKVFSPNTITSIRQKTENTYLGLCSGDSGTTIEFNNNTFLTIFDSCQEFLSVYDEDKIKEIIKRVTVLAKEPMRTNVWKPRSLHHSALILDGITKYRCLFKDFDETFISNEQDYDDLERILVHMIKSWDTKLDLVFENEWRDNN